MMSLTGVGRRPTAPARCRSSCALSAIACRESSSPGMLATPSQEREVLDQLRLLIFGQRLRRESMRRLERATLAPTRACARDNVSRERHKFGVRQLEDVRYAMEHMRRRFPDLTSLELLKVRRRYLGRLSDALQRKAPHLAGPSQ